MALKAILYAYVLGGITFIPLLLACLVLFTIYTSVPVGELDVSKRRRKSLEVQDNDNQTSDATTTPAIDGNDQPKTRKGWLTMRRTFEESQFDGGYVTLVRSFLDARSKDPKRSRPKDMWYVVLKGKILYLYEDEGMTECEAAIQLGFHDVVIYPEGLQDAELFAKRNAICLKPKSSAPIFPSLTKEMKSGIDMEEKKGDGDAMIDRLVDMEQAARDEAFDTNTPWFIFVRSNVEMEDWYLSLVHASDYPAQTPTLSPLQGVFLPLDMNNLVSTLDEQPDVIPMRWLNALLGRIFYSFYRTQNLESFIIGRLMKKLSKVKRPAFLTDIVVTEVTVGTTTPTFSKPMLKELTKEGDASLEVQVLYKGEIRITVEAMANISIGTFKSYNVKLVLAAVLKELDGNLLVKVKRPPSNRIWYAFTSMPKMVLEVEPIVSDRQITWSMILGTLESRLKEIIQESIVMPNMDDIAFFDSQPYVHRGGIWSDAARRERQQVPEASPNGVVSGAESSEEPSSDSELNKIHSTQERTQTSLSLPEPPIMGTSTSAPSDNLSRSKRRRTWFSTVRGDEFNAQVEDSEEDRGRTVDIEKPDNVQRSRSTPGKPESVPESSSGDSPKADTVPQINVVDEKAPVVDDRPSRSSSRGSGRSHSRTGSTSKPIPIGEPASPTAKTFGSSGPSSPNSTSSFLSTLKSRAGDKQALSNTAKEAMKKWGWGKKDDEKESGSDQSSIGNTARMRIDSFTNKARSSYAEVRAAVENRRKEEAALAESSTANERGRSVSGSTLPTKSTPPAEEEVKETPTPIKIQPQAKTMSIPGIHASHKGEVMSMGYVAPVPPPAVSPPKNPVYRLWKSPTLDAQESNDSAGEEVQPQPLELTPTSSTSSSEAQATPPVAPPIPPRPASTPAHKPSPPPLPPRSSPARPTVSHERVPSTTDVSSQSASEILSSIAKRSSISSPSPSPPQATTPPPSESESQAILV